MLWALQAHGIVMRAGGDVNRHIAQGLLEPVLPQYPTPTADVYAVYPQRHQFSTRVQTFVTYLGEALTKSGGAGGCGRRCRQAGGEEALTSPTHGGGIANRPNTCRHDDNRTISNPAHTSAADTMRARPMRSFSSQVEISATSSTLVSRKAETAPIGARARAHTAIQ